MEARQAHNLKVADSIPAPATTASSAVELLPREKRILQLLWDDRSQRDISLLLGLPLQTVEHQLRFARRRHGNVGTIGLLRRCVAAGVLTP